MKSGDERIPDYEAAVDILKASAATGESAVTIAATMLAESNGNLAQHNMYNPITNTVDVGPMQLNTGYLGMDIYHPKAAYGTELRPGKPFAGDPYLNILAGARYLKSKQGMPEFYVGSRPDAVWARSDFLDMMEPKLTPFFSCLTTP